MSGIMSYVVDIIAALILIIAVILGYKQGFIQSLLRLVGCVAAFVLAFSFSAPAANHVYDSWIAPSMETKLLETIGESAKASASEQLSALLESLPAPIATALENSPKLQETVEQLSSTGASTGEMLVESLMDAIVRPIVSALLQFVIFILLFLVLLFVARLLVKLVKPITKLPLIRQADGLLGAALGAVKGAVFLLAFVTVIQLIAATASPDALITSEAVSNSLLVKWIADINPLVNMFG